MNFAEVTEKRSESAMTVRDLIEGLRECDPDDVVWADGCDCLQPRHSHRARHRPRDARREALEGE